VEAIEVELASTFDHTHAGCVAVGIGINSALDNPPKRVMFQVLVRIRGTLQGKVVPIKKARKCNAPIITWVAEPVCGGNTAGVRTRSNDHCPLVYQRVGSGWEGVVQLCG
jgi:hypothetical protein